MFKLVVLSVVLAVATASPSGIWGAGLAAPLAAGWGAPWAHAGLGHAPLAVAAPIAAVAGPVGAYNYRGPLSLAPGQPANILAADGRPLDTLSVNLDRAVHYTAKAVDGHGHWLKKRSVVAAPWAAAHLAAAPVVGAWGHSASWVAPAPVAVAAAAPWGLAHGARLAAPWGLGHGAHVGHLW
ncbi:jg25871 [Pararge aegeria aegeria]|uniref:Jg25871 protein n=2 Tax=Pararge aegeria TaxID=116150 RepID=A0A8S4RU50_9NEOP|nr:jg25871 [Pararge aegeria aegeria]